MVSPDALPWKSVSPRFMTEADEQLLDSFDTHWIKYVRPIMMYILYMGVALAFLLFAISGIEESDSLAHLSLGFAMVIALPAHHWFFFRLLSEAMEDITITNKRLIYRNTQLWVSNDMREIALSKIRAIEVNKHGITKNLFRYGTLWFDTGGGSMNAGNVIPLVPKPEEKSAMILHLLEMK